VNEAELIVLIISIAVALRLHWA